MSVRSEDGGRGDENASRPDPVFERLDAALAGTGLFARGGFHPAPEDAVPALADGRPPATVVLLGNAGPALWRAFRASGVDTDMRNPLDRWIDAQVARAATVVGAEAVSPMREPYPPIQRWARKADAVHPSPLGLLIHVDYGLWHVYRGALLFAERLVLPPRAPGAHPCESCANRPCLKACPVSAFTPTEMADLHVASFDPPTCVDHVESEAGGPCRRYGCLTRRVCPVGRAYRYDDEACAFHMNAVVGAVRRMEAKGRFGR